MAVAITAVSRLTRKVAANAATVIRRRLTLRRPSCTCSQPTPGPLVGAERTVTPRGERSIRGPPRRVPNRGGAVARRRPPQPPRRRRRVLVLVLVLLSLVGVVSVAGIVGGVLGVLGVVGVGRFSAL